MRYADKVLAPIVLGLCLTTTRFSVAQESVIYSFPNASKGVDPAGGLIIDAKGNLYGAALYGGSAEISAFDGGTVFELSPVAGGGWTERVLHAFPSSAQDGFEPNGSLVADGKGNLYGTTYFGGSGTNCGSYSQTGACGTVFELSPASNGGWTENILYSFGSHAADGFFPIGGLTFDAQGNLYGITSAGTMTEPSPGQYGYGSVFELTKSTGGAWTEKVIYSFSATSAGGPAPLSGLAIDSAGILYGTTYQGGTSLAGNVFELARQSNGTWVEKDIHDFAGGFGDGTNPSSSVILDSKGNLYGTTSFQPSYSGGDIYELSPAAGGAFTEKILFHFYDTNENAPDGFSPAGGLTLNAAGNIYGTTQDGGVNAQNFGYNYPSGGTVFELMPQAEGPWTFSVLHSFLSTPNDGSQPNGSLVFDSAGNLYGTTPFVRGTSRVGTVFEVGTRVVNGTTTTLAVNPNANLIAGRAITLTAIVQAIDGTAIPTGSVTFSDPQDVDGTVMVPLDQTGAAVYKGEIPPAGTYSVVAYYSGAPGFSQSASAVITRTVAAPPAN